MTFEKGYRGLFTEVLSREILGSSGLSTKRVQIRLRLAPLAL